MSMLGWVVLSTNVWGSDVFSFQILFPKLTNSIDIGN